jgi:hypothetical protein
MTKWYYAKCGLSRRMQISWNGQGGRHGTLYVYCPRGLYLAFRNFQEDTARYVEESDGLYEEVCRDDNNV